MLLKANLIFWPKWNKKSLKYFFLPATEVYCTVECSDRLQKKCFALKIKLPNELKIIIFYHNGSNFDIEFSL